MTARHVVLLTYGEPPRPGLLTQLRYSWRILLGLTRSVADIPKAALPFIALSRAFTRTTLWRRERFTSPLEPITRAQAEGLAAALSAAAPGVGWRVHVAYEFRDPLLVDVVGALPPDEPVDVVPMYAADSAFTHELARQTLDAWQSPRPHRAAPVRVLPPLSIDVQADIAARHLRNELARRAGTDRRDDALVLAAHGTLLDPPRPYETGRVATERLAQEIARRLQGAFGITLLGWLNHSFGGRWTEPPVDEVLRRLTDQGYTRVVYFPFGFLADNAESLLEGRLALRGEPRLEAFHVPCLNASADLCDALAAQIVDSMRDESGALEPTDDEVLEHRNGVQRHPSSGKVAWSSKQRVLDHLEPGERTTILRLEGDSSLERRLMELGLVPGTPIQMVRRAPFGDPVEFLVRDVSLSLRRSETRRIHVTPH